ncbi:Prolyl 4-hydroxylase subunit alpha-1 [Toxocara canis]|nr:Prolyl 4-hydroxylase subunit alpha-1 [Toxocara canis]
MESLLDAEKDISKIIEDYIASETARLENLRKVSEEYQNRNEKAISEGLKTVTNPISAFLLINHLMTNWRRVEQLMKESEAEGFLRNVTLARHKNQLRYPTEEDLSGATIGLLRLQDTYRLDTTDIANGKIMQAKMTKPLTANDCYEIGRHAYTLEDYYHTILWMQEAKDRLRKENPPSASLADILEYLAFSLYKQGNLKRALQVTEQLYRLNPEHPHAKGNMKWYEDLLVEEGIKPSEHRRDFPPLQNRRPDDGLDDSERTIYEALCRNEVPVSTKATSQLYCYYKMDRPYLYLAPFKVQIMRFNPLVVLFIDVISDEEVEMIQLIAKPRLKRATVQNSRTGELETATYRISKSAWLRGTDHEVVDRINKRIELMTNLDQESSEELQIANYGVGGHYDPHFDFARSDEPKAFESLGTGNRIATALFYMTQPEIGGGTVFTELRTTVMPSKNNALFWYNLYRSGEGDLRTRHAACPVLVGLKWVANKWIHERKQEFRRPCALKLSVQERYVGDLGAPEPRNHPNISPF